uniref:Uncharacterized protein n=1 Tax=Octopus bimaculoides TaxID=37653 RepID=A0A0L8GPQ1_OCTBM
MLYFSELQIKYIHLPTLLLLEVSQHSLSFRLSQIGCIVFNLILNCLHLSLGYLNDCMFRGNSEKQ